MVNDLLRLCIVDIGCNLTTIPLSLVQLLVLKIVPADLHVSIAHRTLYIPLGLVTVTIMVDECAATLDALVSMGESILLGLDWLSVLHCMLDIANRRLSINLLEQP